MAFTLSHASHLCACLSVCMLGWVFYKHTHTHTHTHTPSLQTIFTWYATLCAKKSLHSLNSFIRSSNHFGISFSQQPFWYFFQSTTTLVSLSLSLDCTYFFVCTKIFRKTWVFQIFLERKIGKQVYYIQQDIVNKYLFFHLLLQKLQVILYFLFRLHTVFPISVTPSGHYSVLKKIFKCCTK